MSELPYQGWLHHDDGELLIVGLDGFCYPPDHITEILDAAAPALDVPTIDVAPESVADREVEQRGIDN